MRSIRVELTATQDGRLSRDALALDAPALEASPSAATPRQAAKPASKHRADLDGLRGLATAVVVLTHVNLPGLIGGPFGLDVFFVLSGYLIQRDLVKRITQNRFRLREFYGRRMFRTLPALYFVMSFTLIGCLLVLMPGDLAEMVQCLIGAILFVPNIVLYTQAGYFDTAALSKPLLHTWSLGVEEQFYLIAPLLPLALLRLDGKRRRIVLWVGLVGAVIMATVIRDISRDAAYYFMPSRIFEFLIGIMVAEGVLFPKLQNQLAAEIAAALSFVALTTWVIFVDPGMAHPGLITVVPCVAAAWIIEIGATRQTWTGTFLSFRAFTFIGLTSYSIYLWHWPMIVLARYEEWPLTPVHVGLGVVLLLAISYPSWRFIEQPFRDPTSVWRKRAPKLLPVGAVAILATCVFVTTSDGLPGRFPGEIASISSYYAYRNQKPYREGQCFITSKNSLSDYDRRTCLAMSDTKPNVLLVGDSHAAHLWTGLRDNWPELNVMQATASGCHPLIGAAGSHRCVGMMQDMFDRYIPSHHFSAIVLSSLWEPSQIPDLLKTIAAVKGYADQIVVFGPMPQYDEPLATLLAKALQRGDPNLVEQHRGKWTAAVDAAVRAAVAPVATYISTYDAMCPKGVCRVFAAPGVPMQYDYHHLTPQGVDVMMQMVKAENRVVFRAEGKRAGDPSVVR